MQIKVNLLARLLLSLSFVIFGFARAQDNKENKLVEFKGLGQWEVWCLDINQSGTIECNLNHVLRYKDHPDFRAMIFRFYSDGEQITRLTIDHEWQTSFARGFLQIDDFEQVDLSDCSEQCDLENKQLENLVDQLNSANKARIRFHDYFVQEFEESMPLSGFAEGVQILKQLQTRFNR